MTIDLVFSLAAFAFVSLITPGPNNLMLLASGLNHGWSRSVPHMLGIGIGFPLMILMVGFGIQNLFDLIPHSYTILKFISIGYLLYLAWNIAITRPVAADISDRASKPLSFIQAAAFQWLNPKAWAMALYASTIYAPAGRQVSAAIVTALVFAAISSLTLNSWTLMGQQLRHFLANALAYRCFNIVCAFALVATLYPILRYGE